MMQPRAVACVLAACLACAAAQMADNLMVSGSDRPFSEGIGSANRGEGGSASGRMPTVMVTDRASGAYFNDGSGNVTRYDTTGSAMVALARFLGSDISKQVAAGRRLLQQPMLTRNASDLVGAGCACQPLPTACLRSSCAHCLSAQPLVACGVMPDRRPRSRACLAPLLFLPVLCSRLSGCCWGRRTDGAHALQPGGGAGVLCGGPPAAAQEGRAAQHQHAGRQLPDHLQQRLWRRAPVQQGWHADPGQRRPVARHLLGVGGAPARAAPGPRSGRSPR